MRSIRTKTWAKTVACLIFILSATAVLMSLWPVDRLIYDGAYQTNGNQSSTERREEDLAVEYTHQLSDLYVSERMGDNPSQIPLDELLGDPNFFFTIKDAKGKTIEASPELGDYCERYEMQTTLTHYGEQGDEERTFPSSYARSEAVQRLKEQHDDVNIEYFYDGEYGYYATYSDNTYSEDLVLTGFIRSPLIQSDSSYIYHVLGETAALYAVKDLYLIALVAGLVLSILSLLFLTWSAGRVEDCDGVALHWLDTRLPLEFLLLPGFLCITFGLAVVDQNALLQWNLVTVFILLGVMADAAICLALYLSLIRRIKAKALWDCMLLRKLGRPGRWCWRQIRRFFHAIRRGASSLMGKLPLFWTAGLGFLCLSFLEFLSIWVMLEGDAAVGLFFWLLVKLLTGAIVVYVVLSMRELQHGAYQLAKGNLDYQVPLEKLRWDFKTHGEQLNSMRSAIQAAVEDQMKSERMKTELITNVSHDIKTPLTSIVNYVDLLKKQEMPTQEAKEYLEVLDRQSAKLKKLTEDLVEAAKATSGSTTVNFQRTDVNVLLTQSAGEYQEKLQSKALQLMLTPAPGNPAISADGRLLWRIFENLLSNIYKYALPGTRVYLTCTEEADKVAITFRNISENPLNISAEELMERFVRGDSSRHTEGSGLGLSIARSLTQLQYGSFDIAIDGDLFKATLTFPKIP